MKEDIMVSVICNAYNHEPYISKCLDGLVMQITNFRYEILIHDDASRDRTAEIIREYEKRYPEIIKPIYQTENQYSKGGIGKFQYPRAKGKYIAFCEGDDYWTDSYKLQKQFDALEAHPEVDMCAHAALIISEDGTSEVGEVCPRQEICIIPAEDVIAGDGGFVATNSLMYRNGFENNDRNFRKVWSIDYSLQIAGALRGGMLYLPEIMSVYRYMSMGSWSAAQANDIEKRKDTLNKKIAMLQELNSETKGVYHDVIENTIAYVEFWFFYYDGPFRKAMSRKYKKIRRMVGRRVTLKLLGKIIFPWTILWKRKGSVGR